MEFATGAMGTLLPRLAGMLMEEYNLKESVKNGIRDLKAELESMEAALVKVSSIPLDQLDPQVNIWANEVRELSYAIEDSLDTFVTRVDGIEPTKPKIKHLLKKARNEFNKFKARHEIASGIKNIETQVRKIKERRDRYKIDDAVAIPATTTPDPRILALYEKKSDLVGIDKAIGELVKVLSEGVDIPGRNLKIVSIVGIGGLGKTTLAKALYDELNQTYQCHTFVPVGQKPNTKKVLRDILLELDMELYRDASTMDERQLIDQLRKFLAGKRYFIVIDDIWDMQTWEMIKCAFMDSHPESRLIITTRIVDVAKNVGGIYHMEPLSYHYSKMLFDTRTYGSEGPTEVTTKILKKCGGVPLAIITIASLFVGKHHEDWSKTCLLYLSMFPEDAFIEKNSLIWLWVSEGFVPDSEVGENCFNKLVNKSMIQWMEPKEYWGTGLLGGYQRYQSPSGCRVHDMVLDLIRTISSDVNFVTVPEMEQHGTCSRGKRTNRVQRLALHGGSAEHISSIEIEHVRSFIATSCSDSRTFPLWSFKVLRVLVMQSCEFPEDCSLKHLGKLVHLRYLLLANTCNILPERIGHDLKFLEVLDLRRGLIGDLPPSVGELRNLRCLQADMHTKMKGEIGKLTSLEELQLYKVNKCPNFYTDVGNLIKLRVLKIHFKRMDETTVKALMKSLCKLCKIQSLTVGGGQGFVQYKTNTPVLIDGSLENMAPSPKLCLLSLEGILVPKMPSWINSSRVPLLYHLCLKVQVVEARDILLLGRLPSLINLILEIEDKRCVTYTFGSGEFHKLEKLETTIEIGTEEGALPMLKILLYGISSLRENMESLVSWNNSCPLLEGVTCRLDCAKRGNLEISAIRETLYVAARDHPNYANIREFYIQDENRISSKEGDLIDKLRWVLSIPDDKIHIVYEERRMRNFIIKLETRLRDAAEPGIGRYGQQELRDIVAKFKSRLLHDSAGTNQEENIMSLMASRSVFNLQPDNGDATSSADQQPADGGILKPSTVFSDHHLE
ncbi:disease resistance protein RGA5-like, partial [Triticum dicoccoides]|uniref:disease resistance protein RGA5-like n=1 Tax=Triticum dicoccoides TaxID=85692 RepID=UPI001890C539